MKSGTSLSQEQIMDVANLAAEYFDYKICRQGESTKEKVLNTSGLTTDQKLELESAINAVDLIHLAFQKRHAAIMS